MTRLPVRFPPVWLIGLLIALAAVRLVGAAFANLTEDEAYYRLWALAPQWGYPDHPPMVAWWIRVGMAVLGDTSLGIRAPAVVAGILGALALWRTALLLTGSATIANRAAVWLQATPLIGLGGIMITPDAPVMLFWGLSLWCLAEWLRARDTRWFVAVGVFAGLGLISKYSMLFFGAGVVLWLASDRRLWPVFPSPWLWTGGVLALAIASPVVLWNAEHDWMSFEKQFGRAAADGFTFRYVGELAGGVIGLLNPLIALFVGVSLRRTVAANAGDAVRLILLTGAPFAAYLLYHVFHDRVQANWPAPLYPGLVLLGAIGAQGVTQSGWTRLRGAVAPIGIGVSLVLVWHAVSPLTVAAGRKDPILRTTAGWDGLGASVARIASEQGASFVATSSYVLTGQMAWTLRDGPSVVPLTEPERYLNGAVTSIDRDTGHAGQAGLYVVLQRRDQYDLSQWFELHDLVGSVPRLAGRRELEVYNVYRVVR